MTVRVRPLQIAAIDQRADQVMHGRAWRAELAGDFIGPQRPLGGAQGFEDVERPVQSAFTAPYGRGDGHLGPFRLRKRIKVRIDVH